MNKMLNSDSVVQIDLQNENLTLLPQRCVWWPARKTLIVSDMHWGKSGHFRSEGLPVPQGVLPADLERLCEVVEALPVARILCLGDLFHSRVNPEWPVVLDYRARIKSVEFVLVRGNHDRLDPEQYNELNIQVVDELREGPFLFIHDPSEADVNNAADVKQELYSMSGHIHPGVRLVGRGRQSLRLPCFFVGTHNMILPAFSEFTGLALLRPGTGDRCFVIAEGCVLGV